MPHGNYKYLIGQRYDDQVREVVHGLSGGRDIDQCFGLFADGIELEKRGKHENVGETRESNLVETGDNRV